MSKQPLPSAQPFRLIIADDHEFTRIGLRTMLADEPEMTIIGEAADGQAAVDLCREHQPDLALLDMRMPILDGLAATYRLKAVSPHTRVMIVTMHEDPGYLLQALQAGVAGYVLKDATRRTFLAAVRQVLHGETFVQGNLTVQLLQQLTSAAPTAETPQLSEPLTPREREVLRLVALGQTNRAIGENLAISLGTVKIHVEHILAKLGVADRTQAAVRAVQLGLVNAEAPPE